MLTEAAGSLILAAILICQACILVAVLHMLIAARGQQRVQEHLTRLAVTQVALNRSFSEGHELVANELLRMAGNGRPVISSGQREKNLAAAQPQTLTADTAENYPVRRS